MEEKYKAEEVGKQSRVRNVHCLNVRPFKQRKTSGNTHSEYRGSENPNFLVKVSVKFLLGCN